MAIDDDDGNDSFGDEGNDFGLQVRQLSQNVTPSGDRCRYMCTLIDCIFCCPSSLHPHDAMVESGPRRIIKGWKFLLTSKKLRPLREGRGLYMDCSTAILQP